MDSEIKKISVYTKCASLNGKIYKGNKYIVSFKKYNIGIKPDDGKSYKVNMDVYTKTLGQVPLYKRIAKAIVDNGLYIKKISGIIIVLGDSELDDCCVNKKHNAFKIIVKRD